MRIRAFGTRCPMGGFSKSAFARDGDRHGADALSQGADHQVMAVVTPAFCAPSFLLCSFRPFQLVAGSQRAGSGWPARRRTQRW
jgi:hypothetical protein